MYTSDSPFFFGSVPNDLIILWKTLTVNSIFLNNFDIHKNTNKKAYVSIINSFLKKYGLS
ncbi:hypothetical protein CUM95_11805 [Enterococcus faecium]|nr:hypothetical protein [Enterococcus faecium]PQC37492.1 hypothetical protein CUM95_11805 [Enterococcus faecium]